MDALWRQQGGYPTPAGVTAPYRAWRWRWSDLEPMLRRAGELVQPGPDAHRRVIQLICPDLASSQGTTHNLSMAVQMVLPGEEAPSHRHTMTAIRFALQGSATTMVDGEPCTMEPGDLVLTPNWSRHGHTNDTGEPAVWVDNLDVPMVRSLRAGLFEDFGEGLQPASKQQDESYRRFGLGHLRPFRANQPAPISPLLSYPWLQTDRALHELSALEGDPFDDVALEYTNPTTGGHVLPTMACQIQLLRPGVHTKAHRHSTSGVYHVFLGHGSTIVDGERIDWAQGDFLALPPWCWHEHVNGSPDEEAVLYSSTDAPLYEALELYREETFPSSDGFQEVLTTYEQRSGDGV